MTKIEQALMTLGRLKGAYQKGVSSVDAALTDERGWTTSRNWGPGADTGKPKTAEDAMRFLSSWVYVSTSMQADVLSSVPLRLYANKKKKGQKLKWAGTDIEVPTRAVPKSIVKDFESRRTVQKFMTQATDGIEEITDHPLLDLIHAVNPFSNFSDLIELTSMFMDMTGSAYWYLIKNGLRVPKQIWCIPAQFVTPVAGKTLDTYITGYQFKRGSNEMILPVEDVVPFHFPNPNNEMIGLSVVNGVAEAVYNNSQMNAYEAALFENKASIEGVFESDATITQPQLDRAREDYDQKFAGTSKAGKRPVLPPGMKFTPTAQTRQELSYVEGHRFTMMEILAGFNIPSALFDPSANRATAEAAAYHLAKYGTQPRSRKIEEHANERLVPMYGGNLFLAFDPCVPDDNRYLLDARIKQTGIPFLSPDEARAEVGKEPYDIKGVTDLPWAPAGYLPIGTPAPPPPASPATDQQAQDLAQRTMKALKKMLT